MKTRTFVALCFGLFAVFAANRSLAQVYDPTYQEVLNADRELEASHDGCGGDHNASFVNGQITGLSAVECPAVTGLLGHYKLSDFYGQVSVQVTVSGQTFFSQTLNGQTTYDKAYFDNIGTQFHDLFGLGSYNNFTYTGVEAVTGVVTIEGLKIIGSVPANSNTVTVSVPQLTSYGPKGFQLVGTGATREAAVKDLGTVAAGLGRAGGEQFAQAVLAYWAHSSSTDLLAGNPTSAQGVAVRDALNLNVDDSVLEAEGPALGTSEVGGSSSRSGQSRSAANAGSWMIGLQYGGTVGYGSGNTDQLDGQVQKNWRIFEGQRTRLQLSIPVDYSDVDGRQAFQAGAALGLEQPLLAGRWSLEPQISWGVALSNKIESIGHIATATLTSRYRIDGVGRGYFIVGNMVGYTETLSTAMFGAEINPRLRNGVFRNGLAYELPLKTMVFGRGASVRASYTLTNFIGSPLYINHFQEASLSFGVRSREGELHNTFEAFRFGVTALWAPRYNLISGVVGFRF